MKKIVLLLSLCLLATIGGAQIIFYVQAPSPNEGNYDFTYAEPGTWGVPDLTDPANSVLAEMVLVDDGEGETNPIACTPVINDLTGKIAVLYRGSCEFGTKAANAQAAGAIAVIIINNLGGAPVDMGAGAEGGGVTIPVVMISNIDGALLRDEIDAGTTEVFIGSKLGLYSNDLGFTPADLLRPERFGNIQALSQSASEFNVELGSWVRNYGTNDQTGVVLTATVTLGASVIHTTSSDPVSIESGDSVFLSLDAFSQATYANGYYHIDYEVTSDAADESEYDNANAADFLMNDDLFSLARLDEGTSIPVNSTNQFNGTTSLLYTCLFFEDPNASRIGVRGVNYSAGSSQNPDPTSLDGQAITFYVYEWNDAWADVTEIIDQTFFSDIDDIASGEYYYTENLQSENIYFELDEPVLLEDDQRYLMCIEHGGNFIYPGYDTKIDYNWNLETYLMPTAPIYTTNTGGDMQWFYAGFGTDRSPSMSIRTFGADELGLVEVPTLELEAYPNPASQVIHIPLVPKDGNIALTIVDVNGRIVDNQNVTMNGPRLDVDVTALAPGLYVINLEYADGTKGSINVAVSK